MPTVYSTSNTLLAAQVQQWASSLTFRLTGPTPNANYSTYRVVVVVKYRTPSPASDKIASKLPPDPTALKTPLAEFLKPYRGRWKMAATGSGNSVRYDDYLTVSNDGLTLTHEATNGPELGTHAMPLILIDAQEGLVIGNYWNDGKNYRLFRLKDGHIDWVRGTVKQRDGKWHIFRDDRLLDTWMPLDGTPHATDPLRIDWIYKRAN
jgi:hypothetical protein